MRMMLLTLFLMSFMANAAKGVKCKVYQEFLNENRSQKSQPTEISLNENNQSESTYLKTVVSNFDANIPVTEEKPCHTIF